MRILWITNQPVPSISVDMGVPVGNGGGWMNEMSCQLAKTNNLGIAFPVSVNCKYKEGKVGNVDYYAVPMDKMNAKVNQKQIRCFEEIIRKFKPDVVHIWGTEYMHSFWAACACRNEDIINRTVVSIQGLISVINRHYYGHIEGFRIKVPTIRNIYLNDSMQKQRKDFKLRGEYERRTIEMVHNVIGRTDFDKACTIQINPNIKYHFCNETLRGVFYENRWSLDNCRKHSLFVSQYQYPLKGFHHALEAVFILKKRYPDVHLYTTGRNILKKGIKERLLDTRYEKYIRKIIMDFHLENNVTFLGSLNESEMCARFCETHVFVSASSIENSPNSVGEAMLLGVPTVASDVGGVKNMLEHTKEGYVYQADAPYMLAYYIANIFDDDTLAKTISRNSREHAVRTHNKEDNYERIINIYHEIMTERG